MGPDERDRALALLRDQHTFPGEFGFRVVAHPHRRTIIVSAVAAAAGGGEALVEVTERESRQGNYVALHLRVLVADAAVVLDVYEVLRGVDGVLTVM